VSRRFTAIPVLAILILSTLLLLGAGGCYSPGGGLFAGSNSPFTYISTAEYPKTFVLVNTKTGENIFEMDIPVGKGLVVKFLQGQGDEPAATPDLMKYGVFSAKDMNGMLSSSMTVPGPYSRRIDIFLTTGETYTAPDENRPIRTDTKEDRPSGWTSDGGPSDEVAPDPMNFYDP